MACRGICINYKIKKPIGVSRYALGHKLCTMCETWLSWKGLSCPCCHLKLRHKPRKARGKELLNNVH